MLESVCAFMWVTVRTLLVLWRWPPFRLAIGKMKLMEFTLGFSQTHPYPEKIPPAPPPTPHPSPLSIRNGEGCFETTSVTWIFLDKANSAPTCLRPLIAILWAWDPHCVPEELRDRTLTQFRSLIGLLQGKVGANRMEVFKEKVEDTLRTTDS